jgi:hypothetical protein
MIRLQAHALNRYVRCNGAYHMPLPEAPSEYENTDDRREGIAAHWLAMQVIKGDVLEPAHMIDQQAPNGVYITSDMVEHIQPFVDDVRDRVVSDHAEPFVEEPCDFSLTPTIHIGCRIDTATYDADSGTLSIDEFKYGYRIVEPVDNWQLVAGVIGWMQKFDMPVSHVRLTIHQPRPQHANGKRRSLRLTIAEFEELEARLRWSLIGIETNSVATSGEWCYRCPALAHCTAAVKLATMPLT